MNKILLFIEWVIENLEYITPDFGNVKAVPKDIEEETLEETKQE